MTAIIAMILMYTWTEIPLKGKGTEDNANKREHGPNSKIKVRPQTFF